MGGRMCVYWKVSVGLKWACNWSRILIRVEMRGRFECICIEKNSAFGWHFTTKIDRRVERVNEVNKNGNFLHWNLPQRKDKPLPNKWFQWASHLQSSFHVHYENNGESGYAILFPIAMASVCTKCFSLHLKEFSSSMSRVSSRKSLVGIGNFWS